MAWAHTPYSINVCTSARALVHTFVFLGFYATKIAVPAAFMLGYWMLVHLVSGLPALGQSGSVAFWAHMFVTYIAQRPLYSMRGGDDSLTAPTGSGQSPRQKTYRARLSATQHGFCWPSTSITISLITSIMPPLISTILSVLCVRTRAPTGTGAGNRTLLKP